MKPLIAIVGNTGVGKSQFGVEVARAVGGEIINGDSMQVYRGLDAMTNKHPLAERHGVPHHLLGHIDWRTEYSVKQFEDEAGKLVSLDVLFLGFIPRPRSNHFAIDLHYCPFFFSTAKQLLRALGGTRLYAELTPGRRDPQSRKDTRPCGWNALLYPVAVV